MKIANGVEMLEISLNMMGRQTTINPVLIWDDETVILVDTGFPGPNVSQKIREAVAEAGVSFDKLNKVILTHQDIDHIGGLPDILNASQHKIEVLAHENEKPYIQGEKRLVKASKGRMTQLDSLPEAQRNAIKAVFENPPKANVDSTIADGEELPYCGGITVIYTPGHTPGHICLYLKQSKTLITGDALNVVDGKLIGPNPQHAFDMELTIQSLKKLTQYDVETVICYHGGVYRDDANQRLAELASGQ